MIEVEAVSHTYRTPDGREIPALDRVSLEVRSREFIALLGPSGCGKTTCLRMAAGLEFPGAGVVSVGGRAVTGPGPDRSVVFQQFALFPWKTVVQNIDFGLRSISVPADERARRIAHYIELMNLQGYESAFPHQLSGGMQQRVAIARSYVLDPAVLLMDEPFGALDAQTRSLMQSELLAIWQRSPKTVIFVTHDVQEAVYLAQRVVVMSARPGKVKAVVETSFDRGDPHLFKSTAFVERVDEIWGLVRDEALKAQRGRGA